MTLVRGVLFDIDGVIHVSMRPISQAAETLVWLEQQGYRYCLVTNTTTMSRQTLAQRLQAIGIVCPEERLVTAPVATAAYIRTYYPGKRCWLLSKGNTAKDFAGIELVDGHSEVDVVVIGGAEELLSYEHMNLAFRHLMNGAAFLAMHKNLYWRTQDGFQLDSGPFVKALEFATGKQATVLGKPDRAFFEQALRLIGVEPSEAVMVGDDIDNDIGGAQKVGLQGILVCTGKHNRQSPQLAYIHPEAILSSIADLPAWLQQHQH